MEVAQRYSIAWKGLKNGRHDFRFEVDGSLFEAFESTEIKDGRCEVSVGMDRSEKQLTLDVGITGHVVVECDRCLEDCRVPIDFEGQLVVKFSDEVHEYDGEVIWISDKAEFTPKTIQTRDERANLVYPVKIAVHNDGLLKIGMYADVKFSE